MTDNVNKMPDKDVHAAILAVMEEVGYVGKTKSKTLGYSYVGEAAFIAAVRPAMVAHGLYLSVAEITFHEHESYLARTSNGEKTMMSTILGVKGVFHHVPSGTSLEVSAVGEGNDVGDKSAGKAATYAYKYLLRQTLMIETGDDPDKDSSEQMERSGAKSKASKREEKADGISEKIKELSQLCSAKGGQGNPQLLSLLDAELGGHKKQNFIDGITSVEKANELFEKINKIEKVEVIGNVKN